MSPSEVRLWNVLRQRPGGLLFRRQHPFGPFVFDFYCKAAAVAIEVGGLAHDFEAKANSARVRDQWVSEKGVQTIRVSAKDVRQNLEGILVHIINRCMERTPRPHFVRVPLPRKSWGG